MLFVFSAEAKGTEFYYQQYDYSGIHSLEQSLSDEAKELLKDIGISATDPDFTKNITAKNIFSSIFSFFKSGLSGFKTAFVSLLFILFKIEMYLFLRIVLNK